MFWLKLQLTDYAQLTIANLSMLIFRIFFGTTKAINLEVFEKKKL